MRRILIALTIFAGILSPVAAHASYPPFFDILSNSVRVSVGNPLTSYSLNTWGTTIDSYTVSPALNPGVTLDATTGLISGTPTTAAAEKTYTLTAHNSAGSFAASFTITVLVALGGASPSNNWQAIASDSTGNKLAAVLSDGGIYYSANSGSTWTQSNAPSQRWLSISSSSDGTKLIATATSSGAYISLDSGHTWALSSLSGGDQFAMSSMSSDGHLMVVGTTNSYSSNIWTSVNYGTTWTQNTIHQWFTSVAVSADGSRIVAATRSGVFADGSNLGTQGAIFTSTNQGQMWTQTSAPIQSWTAIAINDDGSKIVASANPGSIYISKDSGLTWSQTSASSAAWTSVAMSSNGNNILGSVDFGGIYGSLDGGSSWSQTSIPDEYWKSVATSGDGNSVLLGAAFYGTILRTTWQSVFSAALYSTPTPIPDPVQLSKISSMTPTSGVANTQTSITVTGNFVEKISAIQINGVGLAAGMWTQTPTSITLTSSLKSAGSYAIQIFNGSVPLMASQTFLVTSAPVAASLSESPKQRTIYLQCLKPGHGARIAFGLNPVCPAGYVGR
jgi:photosystem II stability/assembly factor-like uncharacterized protein